ncbi:MAG: hypothetical protein ACRDHS_09360 [Actinomycetota bacterium]
MIRQLRDQRGIALGVALFALVVIGALVAGAFFVGTQEQRIAESQRRALRSFALAEGGIHEVLGSWRPESINTRAVYPADSFQVPDMRASVGTGSYRGWVYKLNRSMYLVDITGSDAVGSTGPLFAGGARQRIGALVRVRPIDCGITAALTTQGPLSLAGNAMVGGDPHVPPGWTDCDTLADTARAGVRTRDATQVSGAVGRAAGNPPVLEDTTITGSIFNRFGDVTYDELAARANVVLPAGTYTSQPSFAADGSCNRTDVHNWGDGMNPLGTCGDYFPIIHITGGAGVSVLNGVQGQGILLIDGDLNVQGGYSFFGIAILRGRLIATEARLWGAVMAENRDRTLQHLTSGTTVTYSKCAIAKSLQYAAAAALTQSRGWTHLF